MSQDKPSTRSPQNGCGRRLATGGPALPPMFRELILGRRLRSEESEAQRIGPWGGVPVLGLDALASAAYGPEAALTVLLLAGSISVWYAGPITAAIIAVLFTLYVSYRQTIAAYPGGGGAYTVARENLGPRAGLIAASALTLDYILNVAVAISAGTGAVISALPFLQPYTVSICLFLLLLIALANLRGVRESGILFMIPTYTFVVLLGGALLWGVVKSIAAHGRPLPVHPPAALPEFEKAASLWLLLHAFSAGCTAMTGVEAVSNGVPLFREPRVINARRTLTAIVVILACLLVGVAILTRIYHVGATPPGQPGYESVLSQIVGAVAGRGFLYYATMASIVAVLCFSANTSFADFPRLCRVLALDGYLPSEFAELGQRLVYSKGIIILGVLAGILVIAFGGVTDRLIPLFAIGAFLAFTMSQFGMVQHWRRERTSRFARHSRLLNAVGGTTTAATLGVILISKFSEGAWISVLIVPLTMALLTVIQRNQQRRGRELAFSGPMKLDHPRPPIIVIPLKRLDRVGRKSILLAISISPDVHAVQVWAGEPDLKDLTAEWDRNVVEPLTRAGYPPPQLIVLPSPYREFRRSLIRYVRDLGEKHPERYIGVIIPEVVKRRWHHLILHSYRPVLLKALLFLRGGPGVVVISAPWYLRGGAMDEAFDLDEVRLDRPDGVAG